MVLLKTPIDKSIVYELFQLWMLKYIPFYRKEQPNSTNLFEIPEKYDSKRTIAVIEKL